MLKSNKQIYLLFLAGFLQSYTVKNTSLFVESEIVRRLTFKAEYNVTCDLLNSNVSRAVLRSTLTHRRDQIQRICADSEYTIYISFFSEVLLWNSFQ